jgi:hypothetical protein
MAENVTKAETRHARQLFLYGAGDGRRITAAVALAKAAGIHVETIRRHLPTWEAEYEQILAGTSEGGLGLSLSKKQLDQHSKDMVFLRDQIAQVTWECENLDPLIARLETLVEKFAGTDDSDKAITLFDRFLRASMNKQNLRSQFLAMQRQWTKLSGVEGLMDVALTREKTIATGKAKLDLKAGGGPKDVTNSRSGIFATRSVVDAQEGPNDDDC